MANPEISKPGVMQFVLGLLVVTVIGLGAGLGLSKAFFQPEPTPSQDASTPPSDRPGAEGQPETKGSGKSASELPAAGAESKATAAAGFNAADLKDAVLTPFPTITSNIALPESVWIRLDGAMAIKPHSGVKATDLAQLASTKMVLYMKTLKLTDIQGAAGFLALNSDLNEIARNATDGQARAVLISGFIVE